MTHVKANVTIGSLRRLVREEMTRADLWARGRLKDPEPKEEDEEDDTGVSMASVSARGPML